MAIYTVKRSERERAMSERARRLMAKDERQNREAYLRMGRVELTDAPDDDA